MGIVTVPQNSKITNQRRVLLRKNKILTKIPTQIQLSKKAMKAILVKFVSLLNKLKLIRRRKLVRQKDQSEGDSVGMNFSNERWNSFVKQINQLFSTVSTSISIQTSLLMQHTISFIQNGKRRETHLIKTREKMITRATTIMKTTTKKPVTMMTDQAITRRLEKNRHVSVEKKGLKKKMKNPMQNLKTKSKKELQTRQQKALALRNLQKKRTNLNGQKSKTTL